MSSFLLAFMDEFLEKIPFSFKIWEEIFDFKIYFFEF